MLRISGLVQTAKDYLVSQKRLITLLEGGLVIVFALLLADLAKDRAVGAEEVRQVRWSIGDHLVARCIGQLEEAAPAPIAEGVDVI